MHQACVDRRLGDCCWEGAREAKTRTVGLGGQRWAMGTSFWVLNKLGANASVRHSVSCVISSWTGEGLPLGTG